MTVPATRSMRLALATLCTAVLLTVIQLMSPSGASDARAADLSGFNPGFIISDTTFYDTATMGAADIQGFLDTRGAGCKPGSDGTPCLKDYAQDTTSRSADSRCTRPYQGAAGERASTIIYNVAQACGISPRVLLVMLQKEQGLVTASGNALYANRYRSAMGYGCPDTAACDTKYYGFFNQVYSAAWQLKSYAVNPNGFGHRAGIVNNVRFHPNAACGSAPVMIHNQATASLYNYTPYQPNAAALAAGYGTGDSCSSYGNRNFWSYFTDWFGSTTAGGNPLGSIDQLAGTDSGLTVSGWALDLDVPTTAVPVHVYVDGVGHAITANQTRADIGAKYPGAGNQHGFQANIPVANGQHTVCVYAITPPVGPNPALGCQTVTVQAPQANPPVGVIDSLTGANGAINAKGWAFDWDTTAPIPVHMYVDGVGYAFNADLPSPAVNGTFPTVGPNHAYDLTVAATPGTHQVCLYAINLPSGPNTILGCRTVTVASTQSQAPVGVIDSLTGANGTINAKGWAFDWDTTAPIPVHMYVDGVGYAFNADLPSPAVNGTFPTVGPNHAYDLTVAATPGTHQVCLYAINLPSGPNTILGCRTVTVASTQSQAPVGVIDSLTGANGAINAKGWAFDWDTTAPIPVHMYVDGVGYAFNADLPSPAVNDTFPTVGPNHAYDLTVAATPGTHQVCLYAINLPSGPNTVLGCRTVTVN
ncbi:hypothetical protein [Cellulomonas timonensis]|uniref:hypothetical protein n=1 Tax=Cellulomonas timonensis TaxID=1689271 RepID=UPI00082F6539|nr:hypothetical protein [Cellulomonas timonensis]